MLFTIVISLVTLLALAGLFQFWSGWRDRTRRFPAPGRFVDIGGRRLHARIAGSGGPTVVFEAGISASSVNWSVLDREIAAETTICSYDRAGLGWSDPPPRGSFSAGLILRDLATLLDRLKLPGPYVLVGHSYGGLIARLFAERHPEKVGGLVLVDPVLGCEWAHPGRAQDALRLSAVRLTRVGEWLARFGVVRLASSQTVLRSGIIPKLATSHQVTEGLLSRLTAEMVKLPREIVPVFRSHWCRAKNFRAMTVHLQELPPSFAELREARLDCPVVVISADNLSAEGLAEHRAIAALSVRGEHVIAEGSGHWVQFDRPDVVVEAIKRVVRAARLSSSRAE
jgi:pimeloyl-ACP methyl ester carboxylesterase